MINMTQFLKMIEKLYATIIYYYYVTVYYNWVTVLYRYVFSKSNDKTNILETETTKKLDIIACRHSNYQSKVHICTREIMLYIGFNMNYVRRNRAFAILKFPFQFKKFILARNTVKNVTSHYIARMRKVGIIKQIFYIACCNRMKYSALDSILQVITSLIQSENCWC